MEMRRKDLAVTEKEQIDAIIQSCDCVRLAFADGTHPYIVPPEFWISPGGRRVQVLFSQCSSRAEGGAMPEAGLCGI